MKRHLAISILALLLISVSLVCTARADEKSKEKPVKDTAPKQQASDKQAKPDDKADSAAKADATDKAEATTDKADTQDAEADKAEEEEKKPETLKLKAEQLTQKLSVDGVFEAARMHPIEVKGEKWTSFKIKEVVSHGQQVKKGDVLIEFDNEDIEKAIADKQRDMRLAEISMREAELSFEEEKTVYPLRKTQTERAIEIAQEDFAWYFKVDHEFLLESVKLSLESSKMSYENQLEELTQLEKMYNADELTEETEEIVLKRQREAVQQAEFYYRRAKANYEETMKYGIPRIVESRRRSARINDLALEKAKTLLPLGMERAELGFEKQKISHEREVESFNELKGDRSLMTIKSPVDGMVYYGQCKDGKWSSATLIDKLQPEKPVTSGSTPLTIIESGTMLIRSTFPEAELHRMHNGLKATVKPTAWPELELDATVKQFDCVPLSSGTFKVVLEVKKSDDAKCLMPGMNCKAEIVTYENEDAILVPKTAIKTEQVDGEDRSFVFIVTKEQDAPKKQAVKTGKKEGDKVEILGGLKADQEILVKCPEDESEEK